MQYVCDRSGGVGNRRLVDMAVQQSGGVCTHRSFDTHNRERSSPQPDEALLVPHTEGAVDCKEPWRASGDSARWTGSNLLGVASCAHIMGLTNFQKASL